MQYGRALDCLIREIVYADPALGYVYLLKSDVSDGFYRIGLRPEDAPKLRLIFPSGKEEEPMVAIPLTLPMRWKKFPTFILHGHGNGSGPRQQGPPFPPDQQTTPVGR